jgi:membrane-anchored glycerophosphoryl diester phosphodiesterase (GDPDase)
VFYYIAVEDENFIAALRDSWQLTRGHWIRLFLLLLLVTVGVSVVAGTLSAISGFVVTTYAGRALGTLVYGMISLPSSLLTIGILAEAFTQLRESQRGVTNS